MLRGYTEVAVVQLFEVLLRSFCLGRDDGEPRRRWTGHPPVTLICRETAGRL
jgi:hypothetical protein